MNIVEHNRRAWNQESRAGSEWSRPVDPAVTKAAREGRWEVILTPNRSVPKEWFGELHGKSILCLASGGGQQVPILAAAGARVVSLDLSDEQLAKDRFVADRDGLDVRCVQGDMADLSPFPADDFDLIFHPVSNVFVKDLEPVWRESHRVLKPGCRLLAGFMNPTFFLFDHEAVNEAERLVVKFRLPYEDPRSLLEQRSPVPQGRERPLEFGHSLESQLGGQMAAGFSLRGLYEDYWNDEATPLNQFSPTYVATLAEKGGL